MTWQSRPVTVWIVTHRDWEGEARGRIRGVYDTEANATAMLVTKTPSGRRSTALGAHSERCCKVEEYDVLTGTP
jgi:hypothetical protein